jgi:hypothetical protein
VVASDAPPLRPGDIFGEVRQAKLVLNAWLRPARIALVGLSLLPGQGGPERDRPKDEWLWGDRALRILIPNGDNETPSSSSTLLLLASMSLDALGGDFGHDPAIPPKPHIPYLAKPLHVSSLWKPTKARKGSDPGFSTSWTPFRTETTTKRRIMVWRRE